MDASLGVAGPLRPPPPHHVDGVVVLADDENSAPMASTENHLIVPLLPLLLTLPLGGGCSPGEPADSFGDSGSEGSAQDDDEEEAEDSSGGETTGEADSSGGESEASSQAETEEGGSEGGTSTSGGGSSSTTEGDASTSGPGDSSTTEDDDGGDSEPTGGLPEGGYPENRGAGCDVAAGELAPNQRLPDPFTMNDGTTISTMDEWMCRRNEIKKDMERYEIGPRPEPPTVSAALSGSMLTVDVSNDAGSLTITANIGGAQGAGPHCVAIGMDGNASLISGCVQVPYMSNQVADGGFAGQGGQNQSDAFYRLYPDLWGQIGNYAVWSWGISRLIDGLEQVQDELNIDMSRIGVQGCSYAGKMALFGGAFDERVALTVAQESGGGGVNAWRASQNFTSRTGVDVEKIDNTSSAWFLPSMRQLDPYSLPHDHHELVAMVAPRAFVALGNPPYEWLGDESAYKSLMAAHEVWVAMGLEDRFGFDFASGHMHCQATNSQSSAVTAFVDKFLKGQDVDTNFMAAPQASNFDLNYAELIDWETPTVE